MGCNCGKHKTTSSHCNLCGKTSKTFVTWGTDHKICWRCHDAMKEKLNNLRREIDRIETMLSGKTWTRKNYDKRIKK